MLNVRRIKQEELPETLRLIHSVFTDFESADYSDEGVKTFFEFTKISNIQKRIGSGELDFWVCEDNGEVIGTIAMKNRTHICMLFVDKRYHRQGIATELIHTALKDLDPSEQITVNSSPYAVSFYHAVGFADTDELITKDGIKFVPMTAKRTHLH